MAVWLPAVNPNELIASSWGNDVRKMAAGQVGIFELTSNSGGVTATPAPSTMIVTATVPAGRRIKATASVLMNQTAGATSSQLHAAIYLDGVSIVQATTYAVVAGSFDTLTPMRVTTPAAGAHTWQVYVWTDVGGAIINGAVTPATLLVEDIGAA